MRRSSRSLTEMDLRSRSQAALIPSPSRGGRLAAALVVGFSCLGLAYYLGTHRGANVAASEAAAADESRRHARTLTAVRNAIERAQHTIQQEDVAPAPFASGLTSPAAPQTAIEERDLRISQIRRSGRDRRDLIAQANAVGLAWKKLAEKTQVDVSFGPWECHAAGCFVTAVHGGAGSVDKFSDEVTTTDAFLEWNSTKLRSGAIERSDGKVEITWILDSPPRKEQPAAGGDLAALGSGGRQ